MRYFIFLVFMTYVFSLNAGLNSILFDNNEKTDALTIKVPAEIIDGKAFSGNKLLKIPGTGDKLQYSVNFKPISVNAGEKIAFSCLYRTSENLTMALIVCVYRDGKGKNLGSDKLRLYRDLNWEHIEHVFTVPDNPAVKQAVVYIRLVKTPASEALYMDNMRCGKLDNEDSFHCTKLTHISFVDWFNKSPLQERFLFGDGGRIHHDWQMAKLGEACFMMNGNLHTHQFPLIIKDIKVKPSHNYILSFYYRTAGAYVNFKGGMFIIVFRDDKNKIIKKQSRIKLKTAKSWTQEKLEFATPDNAAYADIFFRFYKQRKDAVVYLDDISFNIGKPGVKLSWHIDPDKKILSGKANLISAKSKNGIQLVLKGQNGKLVKRVTANANNKFEVNLTDLPNEEIEVYAEVEFGDKIYKSSVSSFYNYDKINWKNNIGIPKSQDKPPVPWTALTYDHSKNNVCSWNSIISFNDALAITSIQSLNPQAELLQKELKIFINGKDITKTFRPAKVNPLSTIPSEIILENTLVSDTMDIIIKARITYDAFVKYSLKLVAKNDCDIKTLCIKYSPVAMDMQACIDGSWTNYKLIDLRKTGNFTSRRFYPVLWTGNSKQGVYWCAEQLFPAKPVMGGVCQRSSIKDGIEINMVNAPLKLKTGSSKIFEYALGVTPSKPRRNKLRNLHFRSGKYENMRLLWTRTNTLKYYGFPIAANPKTMHKYFMIHKDKENFIYQNPTFAMTSLKPWKYMEKKWERLPRLMYSTTSSSEMQSYGYDFVKIKVNERSWTDFYMQHLSNFLTEYKFSGLYYDCMGTYSDISNGEFRYFVFSMHDFYSRIYTEMARLNPDTIFFLHNGASFFSIAAIFADIILTGEEYRAKCMEHDYYFQFLSPETFRKQMCINTGAWRMFLPQFMDAERRQKAEVAVHTVGLTLVYNLMLYPKYINNTYAERMLFRKFAFIDAGGRDTWKFIPYWEKNVSSNPEVLCSSYINPQGLLLACINSSSKEQKFKLTIKNKYKNIYLYDPLTDKTVIISNTANIKLKAYMSKMILLSGQPVWNPK